MKGQKRNTVIAILRALLNSIKFILCMRKCVKTPKTMFMVVDLYGGTVKRPQTFFMRYESHGIKTPTAYTLIRMGACRTDHFSVDLKGDV